MSSSGSCFAWMRGAIVRLAGVLLPLVAAACGASRTVPEAIGPAEDARSVRQQAAAVVIDTDSLRVVAIDIGAAVVGVDTFRADLTNRASRPITVALDLRAMPGLWLRPNWEHAYVFHLAPSATERIAAPYEFARLSTEAGLRVSFGELQHPLFQRTYDVGSANPGAIDPRRAMAALHTSHIDLYATRGSPAAAHLPEIAVERDAAIDSIAALLRVAPPRRIRLVFYPDSATKTNETGHVGMGFASNGTIVEIWTLEHHLNPYHEIAHIVAGALGDPPALLNEGFATYVSERLGSPALADLSDYGATVDQAACEILRRGIAWPLDSLVTFDEIGSERSRYDVAYPQAASVVKYLVIARGLDRFREAYRRMRAPDDSTALRENTRVLEDLYGETPASLDAAWRASLACR